jgi:hypothetical protein
VKTRKREIKRFREFLRVFCKIFPNFRKKVEIIANIDKILKNFVKYIAFQDDICYNSRKDFIGRLHTYFYVPTVLSSCMFILKEYLRGMKRDLKENRKIIELKNISKSYDGEVVLDQINLYICNVKNSVWSDCRRDFTENRS